MAYDLRMCRPSRRSHVLPGTCLTTCSGSSYHTWQRCGKCIVYRPWCTLMHAAMRMHAPDVCVCFFATRTREDAGSGNCHQQCASVARVARRNAHREAYLSMCTRRPSLRHPTQHTVMHPCMFAPRVLARTSNQLAHAASRTPRTARWPSHAFATVTTTCTLAIMCVDFA